MIEWLNNRKIDIMRRILLILTFLSITFATFADDDIFRRPAEKHLVVDSAEVFTTEQLAALTAKLDSFERDRKSVV